MEEAHKQFSVMKTSWSEYETCIMTKAHYCDESISLDLGPISEDTDITILRGNERIRASDNDSIWVIVHQENAGTVLHHLADKGYTWIEQDAWC